MGSSRPWGSGLSSDASPMTVWTKNDACRSSKQRMSSNQQLKPPPMVSPEGTQERNKNTYHLAVSRRHPPPKVQFQESTGHWPQIAEVLIQGMISVSQALASSHTQKKARKFPGSSVVKTLCFSSREFRFDSWSGN